MSRGQWIAGVTVVLIGAALVRGLWLTADPPTTTPVGVVWHDEGAWTHNARNQALLGVWRTDAWNPVFIAPVFTALEYASFETFGVGTWQARMVPLLSGLVAIVALMAGLAAVSGRRTALIGGLLLATNYTFLMWNRAALMESTMTALLVVSWAAYALSDRRPWWGLLAGAAAVAAFFTKAAAAFFVAALVVEVATSWWLSRTSPSRHLATLMGLILAGAVVLAVFVLPYWTEFQFYNWEMTVTRKPSYSLRDFVDRASWLPIVHGTFTRMWLVVVVAAAGVLAVAAQWRSAHPAQRLAVLWLAIGLAELVVHDSGNERRYVMFVPALIALASSRHLATSPSRHLTTSPSRHLTTSPSRHLATSPSRHLAISLLTVPIAYLVAGSLLRLVWIDDVLAGQFRMTVWASAGVAVLAGAGVWRYGLRLPAGTALVMVLVTVGTDAALYADWARTRTFLNYEASRMLGALLPPGTLVHGKLANGLALENQIAPIFVGRGFGNYADRLTREDARYILSYTVPEPGYEGDVILDVLQHYPQRRVITEFDVQETPGPDRAALIAKFPDGPDPRARDK